jgi:beta-lactamase superfamily II metal-dependent hydrolase
MFVLASEMVLAFVPLSSEAHSGLSRIRIIHFDVNVGDATLFISPEGRGLLIDGGDNGRGNAPILQWMHQAFEDGILNSLEFTIATHYDGDHSVPEGKGETCAA